MTDENVTLDIYNWFDPHNIEHVKAYYHLCNIGTWPVSFIPDNINRAPGWQLTIAAKLADAWINFRLGFIDENGV